PAIGTGQFALEVAYLIPEIRNFLTPYLPETSIRDLRGLIRHTLANSIYGIDLDKEALKIAKFSLLFALPLNQAELEEDLYYSLEKNLYWGNSLLEKTESWPCQFDIILTNPPYVPITQIPWNDRRQYEKIFRFATGRFNLFYLFLEKSESLTHDNSICGFLVPDRLFLNTQCKLLQNWLLQEKEVLTIIPFKTSIFIGAIVDSLVLFIRSRKANSNTQIQVFENTRITSLKIHQSAEAHTILLKIQRYSIALERIATIKDGLIQGKVADQLFLKQPIDECSKKLLFGRDIDRYQIHFNQNWVNYRPEEMMRLEKQRRGEGVRPGLWLRDASIFDRCKILTRQTADEIIAAYDSEGYYYANTLHGTTITDSRYTPLYVLAVLNSSLLTWYYRMTTAEMDKAFAQVKIKVLKQIPILQIDYAEQQVIENLVTQIDEQKRAGQPIESYQEEIDRLIYQGYELTEEEILLVETMKFRKSKTVYR
ncbi:MAG: TaqI-like C-terminal specificity domain-containing protein, partial [Leptolyngbyaceae cyanobacterium bins.59]|nr:TaqI-like C-terminal specificity domain-containing protein [Leptolyngbyaceae cyanobacterium bins.59]